MGDVHAGHVLEVAKRKHNAQLLRQGVEAGFQLSCELLVGDLVVWAPLPAAQGDFRQQ